MCGRGGAAARLPAVPPSSLQGGARGARGPRATPMCAHSQGAVLGGGSRDRSPLHGPAPYPLPRPSVSPRFSQLHGERGAERSHPDGAFSAVSYPPCPLPTLPSSAPWPSTGGGVGGGEGAARRPQGPSLSVHPRLESAATTGTLRLRPIADAGPDRKFYSVCFSAVSLT